MVAWHFDDGATSKIDDDDAQVEGYHSKTILLFDFFSGTLPSCLKVMGWWKGGWWWPRGF